MVIQGTHSCRSIKFLKYLTDQKSSEYPLNSQQFIYLYNVMLQSVALHELKQSDVNKISGSKLGKRYILTGEECITQCL